MTKKKMSSHEVNQKMHFEYNASECEKKKHSNCKIKTTTSWCKNPRPDWKTKTKYIPNTLSLKSIIIGKLGLQWMIIMVEAM